MSPLLDELVQALRCLPGVGAKSAQRMAFHLLERDRAGARRDGVGADWGDPEGAPEDRRPPHHRVDTAPGRSEDARSSAPFLVEIRGDPTRRRTTGCSGPGDSPRAFPVREGVDSRLRPKIEDWAPYRPSSASMSRANP